MSSSDWLSRRTPPAPEELAKAIRDVLKSRSITSENPSPTELLETAKSLLEKVLDTECATRDSALDLLTADALVTYALELANEESGTGDFPELAMKTLADTGTERGTTPSAGQRGPR
jgi:hypothetical protein